jgi:DNA-binding GntR family transcriptional regulator
MAQTRAGLKRAKTSAAVVDYLLDAILGGQLRPGDRVEVDQVSAILGVSPTPVREALVILERDGIVTLRLHRGAFVEPFDVQSLRDDFELLGILSGLALTRLAARPDPSVFAELERLTAEVEMTPPGQTHRVEELVTEALRLQHSAASHRLRAQLASLGGLALWAGRRQHRSQEMIVLELRQILDALVAGDGDRAAQHRVAYARLAGEEFIEVLVGRGVIGADGEAGTHDDR